MHPGLTKWTFAVLGIGAGAMAALIAWDVLHVAQEGDVSAGAVVVVATAILLPWVVLGLFARVFQSRRMAAEAVLAGAVFISTAGPSGYLQLILKVPEGDYFAVSMIAMVGGLWFVAVFTLFAGGILFLLDLIGILPRRK